MSVFMFGTISKINTRNNKIILDATQERIGTYQHKESEERVHLH